MMLNIKRTVVTLFILLSLLVVPVAHNVSLSMNSADAIIASGGGGGIVIPD